MEMSEEGGAFGLNEICTPEWGADEDDSLRGKLLMSNQKSRHRIWEAVAISQAWFRWGCTVPMDPSFHGNCLAAKVTREVDSIKI